MKTSILSLLLTLFSLFQLSAGKSAEIREITTNPYIPELACNDLINISLDTMCQATVQLGMLIENQLGPNSDYGIQIWEGNTLQPDLLFNTTDIGKVYIFKVIHLPSGNSCWGNIHIEDKLAPVMSCSNDTIRCGMSTNPESIRLPIPGYFNAVVKADSMSPNCYDVEHWDYCSSVRLCYTDDTHFLDCDSMFSKVVIRCWTAKDVSGNKAVCYDTIFVKKADFTDIVVPLDFDGTQRPHINCSDKYPKLLNGNPDPIYTGFPVPDGCTKLVATYSDLKFVICETSYKIIRRWTIIDWCTKRIQEFNQVIKVIDDVAPTFDLPNEVFIGMKSYTCGSYGKLPIPTNVKDCGTTSYVIYTRQIDSLGVITPLSTKYISYSTSEKEYYLDGAPQGRMWVIYEVSDHCGNVSSKQIEVAVIDELLPIPVCDEKTVVALTNNGTARVFAETFDNGSIDNCGILGFKARRMDDPCGNGTNVFGNYVDFCCEDVGKRVMIALEVIDNSRNTNICMVEITVQDKEAPVIIAPSDVTITCSTDITDLSVFGKVQLSESLRKNIIIKEQYYNAPNYIAGRDGLATDNCYVEISEVVINNLICSQGTIQRIFTAKDKQGLTSSATQIIYVKNPNPFNEKDNIVWPQDRHIAGCRNADINPSVTGAPFYFNSNCANIAANYEDQLLSKVDSSCYKIFRKWTVLDWCQFNAQSNAGTWTHTQILYIENSLPPDLLSCNTLEICDYNSYYDPRRNACMVNYDITGDAEDDCTKKEFLKWTYRLDNDNDGIFESLFQGNRLTGARPVGQFRIRWFVEDACGNISTCDQLIILKDCKKPTPYCLNGVVTVVMPTNGTVTVWAKDLNLGSFDNCTQTNNLRYSFSSDVNNTSIVYTCDSLEKKQVIIKNVRVYVTDESGNQDYCETTIKIQDNNKACGGNFTNVSGLIKRSDKSAIPYAQIRVFNNINEKIYETTSDVDGKYSFQNIVQSDDYKLVLSKDDDIMNGISTYDIVLIQKDILGKSIFTNPYQILAADVNNSHSITSRDISDIRKLILGISSEFPSKEIWSFVSNSTPIADPMNPWDAKKYFEFKELKEETGSIDFVAVKKGDVDQSAILGFNKKASTRDMGHSWIIGQAVSNNQNYLYPVYSQDKMALEGFQFSMDLEDAVSVVSAALNVTESNYYISENRLTMSWNSNDVNTISSNEVLFYIDTKSELSKFNLLRSNAFASEVYVDGYPYQLVFTRTTKVQDDFVIDLGQNIPNPYFDQTVIPIEVSKETSLNLMIYDVTGKVVFRNLLILKKGMNYVNIDKSQLGTEGIYLYKLDGTKTSQVRKMILKY